MAMVNLLTGSAAPVFISASGSHELSNTDQYIDPSDYQVGDLVLAFATMIDTGDVTTMPSGWTQERLDYNADGRFGDSRSYVWSRVLSSGDVSGSAWKGPWYVQRFNGTGTTWTLAHVHYRGPTSVSDDGAAIYGTSDTSSTTFDAPSVSGSAGMLVVAFQLDNGWSGSGPGSMTERVANSGASGFTSQTIYDEPVSAGASGSRSRPRVSGRAGAAQSLLLT